MSIQFISPIIEWFFKKALFYLKSREIQREKKRNRDRATDLLPNIPSGEAGKADTRHQELGLESSVACRISLLTQLPARAHLPGSQHLSRPGT